jgi:hypothetical protein
MSAAGLIAAVRSTDAGSSVSATSRHMQCSKKILSFDHLVGAGEQHGGDLDPEHPGGVGVDDQLELR